jgi:phosphatidylinositol alpha-mannosyltransferase
LITIALLALVGWLLATEIDLAAVARALAHARPAWVLGAFALMMGAFLMRALSWQQVLRAALPEVRLPIGAIVRAAMIGVMGSAIFPGRLGEPARAVILARRLPGRTAPLLPLIAGTMLSQTVMNLIALAVLALITFSSVSIFSGHESGLLAAALAAGVLVLALIAAPALLRAIGRARRARLARAAAALERILALARTGMVVFARPRHALPALAAQLSAWALQWLACYAVLLALALAHHNGLVAAAAVLLAVNLSAILPPTPSNVGIFQAACLVVLAAFGVSAARALAYGFALQAVELLTALLMGAPALVGEGMSWREVKAAALAERERERASARSQETDRADVA